MRLLKNIKFRAATESEVLSIAVHERGKYVATSGDKEPIIIRKYPYLKIFKKLIHREKLPIDADESYVYALNSAISPEEDIDETATEKDTFIEEKNSKGPICTATKLRFSIDGQFFAVGYENGDVLVFDTTKWEKIFETTQSCEVSNVDFIDHDRILVVITVTCEIVLYETTKWTENKRFDINTPNTGYAIITQNQELMYTISDKKRVRSIDLKTLQEKVTFKGHKSGINTICLSPDEKILATAGNDNKICLFDTQTGELLALLLGHTDEVYAILFIFNGEYLVSSSEDNMIRVWDMKTYQCVKDIDETPNAFEMAATEDQLFMGNVEGEIRGFKIMRN